MNNKEQIERWVREGTITQEQADKMLADATTSRKEETSGKFIVVISTLGSILLGIGAILFIASNWDAMSNPVKVFILVVGTMGVSYLGYVFKYQKQNFPRVGASLMFLGALLFGASLFLIAQMYNVQADSHMLILVWILGILPLVYLLTSESIAALVALLFYIWLGFFLFSKLGFNGSEADFLKIPVLYLCAAIAMFGLGGLHYLSEKLRSVGRIFRLSGLKIAMLSLFILTFELFSGSHDSWFFSRTDVLPSSQLTLWFVLFALFALGLAVINLFFNPSKTATNTHEQELAIGVTAVAMIFFFYPADSSIYTIVFNLLFVALIMAMLYIGYHREDLKVVNMALFWFAALVIARYFDFFWDLLPRSIFFMGGGLVLILGGIAMERKRRQLKAQFIAHAPQ